jgi:hypothetical protein
MKAVTAVTAVIALAAAACSADLSPVGVIPDAPGPPPSDAPQGCFVSLGFFPAQPVAGPAISINVRSYVVDAPGVLEYHWHVGFNGVNVNFTPQADNTQIAFLAPDPGVYQVDLEVTGSPKFCSSASITINVRASGAQTERFRLHVVAPKAAGVPPFDKSLVVAGGAPVDLGAVVVDPGVLVTPLVMGPSGGVPAYLRFAPNGAPDAVVEAFSDSTGSSSVRLVPALYTVLVVPSLPGSVPRRIVNWSSASPFIVVDAGTPITGTVCDAATLPIGDARVQLTIDGVPSTLATTAADGTFLLRASSGDGPVTIEVTPPESSGLPRLSATSTAFDLSKPVAIWYDASLARTDLAGTRVLRDGEPVANAQVTVVGSLATVGKITAGAAADATGEVRLTARTNGSGALPTMLVPSAKLSAVVTVAAGDLAVATLDAADGAPQSLDAPAMTSITTMIAGASSTQLHGAALDLVPLGALAMAAVPVVHVTADDTGRVTAALAAGGHYELRFRDPAGRGAPLVVTDRTPDMIDPSYQLPTALQVRGTVMYGGTQVLGNAAVQILCEDCSGIERARPIAEVASDEAGRFALAVPDPGTM